MDSSDTFLTDHSMNTSWVEGLALEELNMEESGVIHFNEHLSPSGHLEESSLKFMDALRDRFETLVDKFNQFRGNDSNAQIKLFKISNTVNDFMLYRHSLRLVFARKSLDLITVGFLSNSGGLFSARLSSEQPATNAPHEIKAHVGPFNKISWNFQGEPVDVDALVRHYMTEFVKHSAR